MTGKSTIIQIEILKMQKKKKNTKILGPLAARLQVGGIREYGSVRGCLGCKDFYSAGWVE